VKDQREAQTSGRVSTFIILLLDVLNNYSLLKYTTDLSNPNRLQSITQERDLDAFLSAATLAETDFTAGKLYHHARECPSRICRT
jgi:hypothetical protein